MQHNAGSTASHWPLGESRHSKASSTKSHFSQKYSEGYRVKTRGHPVTTSWSILSSWGKGARLGLF